MLQPLRWTDNDGDRVQFEVDEGPAAMACVTIAGETHDAAVWITELQARALRDWLTDLIGDRPAPIALAITVSGQPTGEQLAGVKAAVVDALEWRR
jgi:hypothetical protein